jgi:uncharacterized protein YjbI with pentapeptide repeats
MRSTPMGRKKPGRKKSLQKDSRWGVRGKTLWDWLPVVGALLIPCVIAGGTWVITWQQARLEDRRAEAERALAEQRAHDEALQAYLDQMNNLLLEHNLRNSEEDSGVRTLARARTLTALERLDPDHRRSIVLFLYEAKLIRINIVWSVREATGSMDNLGELVKYGVISLEGANLRDTDLSGSQLGADLCYQCSSPWMGADLWRADLARANLNEADLSIANLHEANLREAKLNGADLSGAQLIDADLRGAHLRGALLEYVGLSPAQAGDPLVPVDWEGADLSGADLSGAKGIDIRELQKEAASLEGATMPNGQKYEDWLKSRGSREQRENTGPS